MFSLLCRCIKCNARFKCNVSKKSLTCGGVDGKKIHPWTNHPIFYYSIGSNISVSGQNRPIQDKHSCTWETKRDIETEPTSMREEFGQSFGQNLR